MISPRLEKAKHNYAGRIAQILIQDRRLRKEKTSGDGSLATLARAMQPFYEHDWKIRDKFAHADTGPKRALPASLKAAADNVMTAFAALADPTHDRSDPGKRYKYLDWVCKRFIAAASSRQAIKAEDLYKIADDLRNFDQWRAGLIEAKQPGEIEAYKTIERFSDTLDAYAAKAAVRRLAYRSRALPGTVEIYRGDEGTVLLIEIKKAAQLLGGGTKWCIAARDPHNRFDDYNKGNPIFYYILAEQDKFGRQIKCAGVGPRIYNPRDKVLKKIPPGLKRLIDAMEGKLPATERAMMRACGGYGEYAGYKNPDPKLSGISGEHQSGYGQWWNLRYSKSQEKRDMFTVLDGVISGNSRSTVVRKMEDPARLADPGFMMRAIKMADNRAAAVRFAPASLRNDPVFMRKVLACDIKGAKHIGGKLSIDSVFAQAVLDSYARTDKPLTVLKILAQNDLKGGWRFCNRNNAPLFNPEIRETFALRVLPRCLEKGEDGEAFRYTRLLGLHKPGTLATAGNILENKGQIKLKAGGPAASF